MRQFTNTRTRTYRERTTRTRPLESANGLDRGTCVGAPYSSRASRSRDFRTSIGEVGTGRFYLWRDVAATPRRARRDGLRVRCRLYVLFFFVFDVRCSVYVSQPRRSHRDMTLIALLTRGRFVVGDTWGFPGGELLSYACGPGRRDLSWWALFLFPVFFDFGFCGLFVFSKCGPWFISVLLHAVRTIEMWRLGSWNCSKDT